MTTYAFVIASILGGTDVLRKRVLAVFDPSPDELVLRTYDGARIGIKYVAAALDPDTPDGFEIRVTTAATDHIRPVQILPTLDELLTMVDDDMRGAT